MSSLFQSLGVTIELETITDSLTQLRSQNEGPVFQIIIGELEQLAVQTESNLAHFKLNFEMSDAITSFVWERLNTGHWSEVSVTWRKLYTLSVLLKIHFLFKIAPDEYNDMNGLMQDLIKLCDVALLLGAPISSTGNAALKSADNFTSCGNVATDLATRLSMYLNGTPEISKTETGHQRGRPTSAKRRKTGTDLASGHLNRFSNVTPLPIEEALSLEDFLEVYKNLACPVIIRGTLEDWPAFQQGGDNHWSVDYLKKVAGFRTVPIELGQRYTDDSWTQSLMTIRHFVDNYLNKSDKGVGYLAQHEVFDQIPVLRQDFEIPEYCFTGSESEEDIHINCWIGPGGTVSPLHTDPKHNCLAQVVGSKHVILFHEDQSQFVSAYQEGILTNTSEIDLEQTEEQVLKNFPEFEKAKGFEGILMPGDILYIPPRCWHYVKSLSTSFSVSFWFK